MPKMPKRIRNTGAGEFISLISTILNFATKQKTVILFLNAQV
jgi:hypothetical protein